MRDSGFAGAFGTEFVHIRFSKTKCRDTGTVQDSCPDIFQRLFDYGSKYVYHWIFSGNLETSEVSVFMSGPGMRAEYSFCSPAAAVLGSNRNLGGCASGGAVYVCHSSSVFKKGLTLRLKFSTCKMETM